MFGALTIETMQKVTLLNVFSRLICLVAYYFVTTMSHSNKNATYPRIDNILLQLETFPAKSVYFPVYQTKWRVGKILGVDFGSRRGN